MNRLVLISLFWIAPLAAQASYFDEGGIADCAAADEQQMQLNDVNSSLQEAQSLSDELREQIGAAVDDLSETNESLESAELSAAMDKARSAEDLAAAKTAVQELLSLFTDIYAGACGNEEME
jgi:hypothetical protein